MLNFFRKWCNLRDGAISTNLPYNATFLRLSNNTMRHSFVLQGKILKDQKLRAKRKIYSSFYVG